MDVNEYERVLCTFFNDGIVNKGRIIVLFCLAKIMGERFPGEVPRIWDIYQKTIQDKGFPSYEQRGRIEEAKQNKNYDTMKPVSLR